MTSGYSLYSVDSAFQLHSPSIACTIWNTLSQYNFDDLLISNHLHLSSFTFTRVNSCNYNNLQSSGQWVLCRRTSCFHPQGVSERQISAVPCADDEAGRPNMPQISTDSLHLGRNMKKWNTRNKWRVWSEMLRALKGAPLLVTCTSPCHSVVFRNKSKGIMVQRAVAT